MVSLAEVHFTRTASPGRLSPESVTHISQDYRVFTTVDCFTYCCCLLTYGVAFILASYLEKLKTKYNVGCVFYIYFSGLCYILS